MYPGKLPPVSIGVFLLIALCVCGPATAAASAPVIADHTTIDLSTVPESALLLAKSTLHIAYGHTSHGSQITTGMTGLTGFAGAPYGGSLYTWNSGGTGGALDLRDTPFSGASDLGNPDRTSWAAATRTYLKAHPDINVVMWSWCGQVSSATEADITTYLNLMSQLETEFPDVKFVYMTGHLDGTGVNGNLNTRNDQIRAYVRANNRILFDFADIESYDPDGNYYLNLGADDACNYNGGNWATDWQNAHTKGVDWYQCSAAHTQPLNANMKAYAAWWLYARLGGWDGTPVTPTPTPTPTGTPDVPVMLPGQSGIPTDPDSDGLYEDVNANGRIDFADLTVYFLELEWIAENEPVSLFDYNGNGRIDFADLSAFFAEL